MSIFILIKIRTQKVGIIIPDNIYTNITFICLKEYN